VQEPFAEGQKGSSAMPHKRNPVLSERICGLARVVRAALTPALEDVALWHERDISHSSVERVILPDATMALDYMLDLAHTVVEGMQIFPERMRANLDSTGGVFFSQRVLLALVDAGLSREDAYRIVQRAASRSWEEALHFREEAWAEAEPTGAMSKDEFWSLFRLGPFVGHAKVVPIECVARGYLSGSGWKEYREHGSVCGIALPAGLTESDRLPEPIFTPSTKEATGHDQNISFDETAERIGRGLAERLKELTLGIYEFAAAHALERGIILADTKFEFGFADGELILIDEVLTPDSSRFWPADRYEPGHRQPSFDKQYVRDWLDAGDWDHERPPPA